MIETGRAPDIERFRSAVGGRLGLHIEDAKLSWLADVLYHRLDTLRLPAGEYLTGLETGTLPEEVGFLAHVLTVPETYFFRNREQFRALTDSVLPNRVAARSDVRRLRILSAGCASGEEAYSLAAVVRDSIDPSWDVSILAVDVNPAVVKKAMRARYSSWALRETPAHLQQRWFRPEGREFALDETVRAAVRFEVRNLAEDDPHLWPPDSYDIVFFRNVLMYLTHEVGRAVIARIARALVPGGYLFLGHAETLRGMSGDFHLQHTHDTFYYQRRDHHDRPAATHSGLRGEAPAVAAVVGSADSWIEAIHRATARIETLTDPARSRSAARTAVSKDWDLEHAHELLREERFTEALEKMQRLPPESGRDPDVLLLRAALLTHRGRLSDAEEACQRLLEVDELSAGAHYLLALCREGGGDRTRATYHNQIATYLDPSFAMPHLHLGLLARRAGDQVTAQRELGHALSLLQREDGSRLLLFGGGFGRETLVALCRTELLSCGGKP